MADAFNRSEEQQDRDAELGQQVAAVFLLQMDGIPIPVAYNVLGNLVEDIFLGIEFPEL